MQYPSNDQTNQYYSYSQQQAEMVPPPMQQYPYGAPAPSQPPKKNRSRTWGIIIGIVVVLVVAIALANAGSQSSKGNTPAPATQTSSQSQSSQPNSQSQSSQPEQSAGDHKIGDPVTLDGWTVTVNSVKRSSGDGDFNVPKTGNVYLLIDVTVVNNTGQSQTASSDLQFSFKDSTGQSYTTALDTAAPASPDGTIANGGKVRGTIVYEVPQSMHAWELDFQPGMFSGDQATWSLTA